MLITSEELYRLACKTDQCYICGRRLNWQLGNKGKGKPDSPTLDRLNNENVLTRDNVVILCYSCNATKRDRSLLEFVEYCGAVATKFHSHLE